MDPVNPTSFIQKRSLTVAERPRRSPAGLLTAIAAIVLVLSLVFFGGTYFYKKIIYDEINKPCSDLAAGADAGRSCGLKATIEVEKQRLNQATIIELQRLDHKFKIAAEVLTQHNTILPLFRLLEELTLPTVRYTSFGYTEKGISLSGEATSYEDIAVQTQVFSKDVTRVSSFVFSDLNQGADNRVTFKLTLVPVADLDSYDKFLANTVAP